MTLELTRRICVTLGVLLVYRLGTYIPLPGIDPSVWDQIFRSQAVGTLGTFNLFFSGGGIRRMAIFALGIIPYLTAAILLQFLAIASARLRGLRRKGEYGRRIVDTYTYALTILLAVFQSLSIAIGLEGVSNLVADPGWLFRISTVLTLTGGTMLLVWLSSQITARGIGNGVTLILFAGIVTEVPAAIARILELGRQGALSNEMLLASLVTTVALTALVVVVERARRRLPVVFQKPQGSQHWELSVKLNNAGLMPTILASWILTVPMLIAYVFAPDWVSWIASRIASQLGEGRPLFFIVYAVLIVGCTFFYTAFVFDPDEGAENLKRHGASFPGVPPGELTAEYIDRVATRITVIGAAYLALIWLIPAAITSSLIVPFYFAGTSLLIVVCAIIDLEDHIRGFGSVKRGVRRP